MAPLADVWASIFPAAVPVAPFASEARAREIGWARVLKARIPAFDALDPGDLAIVPAGPLAAVAPGPAEAAALVAEFIRARVGALLLIEGDVATGNDAALEALGSEAAGRGLATLRTGRVDATALERSIIGFLVNRRAELDRQAALLEERLQVMALEGSDVAGLIAAVGSWLGRAVALESQRGDPLAIHAPADAPAAPAAVQAYLKNPRRVALRIALPAAPPLGSVGADDNLPGGRAAKRAGGAAGSVALLGVGPASELERVATARIAPLLALEVSRGDSLRRTHDGAARGAVLPTDGPPWVALLAEQSPIGPTSPLEQREELRRELRFLAAARRLSLRGDATSVELRIVLAADEEDPGGLVLSGRIGRFLGRTVAVSRPFTDPVDRPVAEAEARATLDAARGLADQPAIARAEFAPAYRLLSGVHNIPDGTRQARALLEPLLGSRPDVVRDRLTTLRAVLDHPAPGEAAAILGVHRNTVAYRIRRIEAGGGWDLSDPELRLALSIAVRLVQSAQR